MTTQQATSTSWKDAAISAYQAEVAETQRADQEKATNLSAHRLARFKERLAAVGIEADPTGLQITLDGVTFAFETEHWELVIPRQCVVCGRDAHSYGITGSVELGAELLGKRRSVSYHACGQAPEDKNYIPPPAIETAEAKTVKGRLLVALRDFIAEETAP